MEDGSVGGTFSPIRLSAVCHRIRRQRNTGRRCRPHQFGGHQAVADALPETGPIQLY
jgi:hypothetical protein